MPMKNDGFVLKFLQTFCVILAQLFLQLLHSEFCHIYEDFLLGSQLDTKNKRETGTEYHFLNLTNPLSNKQDLFIRNINPLFIIFKKTIWLFTKVLLFKFISHAEKMTKQKSFSLFKK